MGLSQYPWDCDTVCDTHTAAVPVVDVCVEEEERLRDCPPAALGRHVQRRPAPLVHRARHRAGPDQAGRDERIVQGDPSG